MKESRYVEYVRKYLNSRARKWKRAQVTGVGTTKEFAYQDARQNARETYGQAFRVRSKKFAKSGHKCFSCWAGFARLCSWEWQHS